MFGWSRKEPSSALEDALERIRALEEAYELLYQENHDMRSRYARALAQAQKNRLDFIEAVQRADRLERKLIEAEERARGARPATERGRVERRGSWSAPFVTDSGSLSDSGSFDPASYEADEGETAVDTRPWDVRRGV